MKITVNQLRRIINEDPMPGNYQSLSHYPKYDISDDVTDDQIIDTLQEKIGSLTSGEESYQTHRRVKMLLTNYFNPSDELVATLTKELSGDGDELKTYLTIDGEYFLSDLGWQPTRWSIVRPGEKYLLDHFKKVWNQQMPMVRLTPTEMVFIHRN